MFNKIAFIGAGSMAEALIAGIIKSKVLESTQIVVTNRANEVRLKDLSNLYNVQTTHEIKSAVESADAIFLAMKPKDVSGALAEIKPFLSDEQVIISVLAGIPSQFITENLGLNLSVIRAMPNTSATIGYSATALTGGSFVRQEQMNLVTELFETVGTVTIVEEEQMHVVTAISGSGPAYFYYIVEAMEKAAQDGGLDQQHAKELINQTILGAAQMLQQAEEDPVTLRKRITSPGGTTESGIKALDKHEVNKAFEAAVKQAAQRSEELGKF
ncbi:pyrroline-5-carboxylate reductase [Paraliobacillus sediminis]|uniref:pyrroline-5-carboxylate reductase n=1 Tax=Paraliobacillus sediminis TaxID=1885916 RepID=UPI000E3C4995|nr:pyrroline-5-carboxylate reductase [Paraliobacillus sediminis]